MSVLKDTVVIESIDDFIKILAHWHEGKVKALQHMLTVPEGVEVQFNDESTQILKGDLHKGFLIGLSLGLMELGALPFAMEFEDSEQPATTDEPVQH